MNLHGTGDTSAGQRPLIRGGMLSKPIAIYECGSSVCNIYGRDPRTQPLEDSVLCGRCELGTLRRGQFNIPVIGEVNCRNWLAGTVFLLEKEGLLKIGEGAFWQSMTNQSAEGMKGACIKSGKKWIPGPESVFEGTSDAWFNDNEVRSVGKLNANPAMRERMEALVGGKGYYVSSPFFSRGRGSS
ncbi:hypothetical protein BDV06DRAFT_216356 [Aspergillus oleicola]